MHDFPLSARVPVGRIAADGSNEAGHRNVPVEMPIAISFCGIGYAVMMATPADLEDFAIGFARSERLIENPDEILEVDVRQGHSGILLGVELVAERKERVFERVRHRVGESSCGLCGIENLEQALRPLPMVGAPPTIAIAALFRALREIGAEQPLNRETGAVHAAALCGPEGAILAAREDVGRHNAFDKLIGHCLAMRHDMRAGFVLLTARGSYELVEKAALAGVSLLVTVSAPTSLAIQRAVEARLTMIALARQDAMLVVSDPYGKFGG